MSYTVSPQDPSWEIPPEQTTSRSLRLLAVAAGAVLFVLGILVGGFMGRSHVPVESHREPEDLAALRAEITQLHQEVVQAKTRTMQLEQQLAIRQTVVTSPVKLETDIEERQRLLGKAIELVGAKRQVCLRELQEYQERSKDVPTAQVIRFAETLFDTQTRILSGLSTDESLSSTLLDLQTTLTTAVDSSAQVNQSKVAIVQKTPATQVAFPTTKQTRTDLNGHNRESVPTLAEPTPANPSLAIERSRQGVFFAAPGQRQQGVTFFTPQSPARVASRPRSGMTFTDVTSSMTGPTLR